MPGDKRVKIVWSKSNKWQQTIGYNIKGVHYVTVPEAIHLVDIGKLEIYSEGLPLSVEQSHNLISEILGTAPLVSIHHLYLQDRFSISHYHVFSHLKRSGYILFESDIYFEDLPQPVFDVFKPERTKTFSKKMREKPDYYLLVFTQFSSCPSPPVLSQLASGKILPKNKICSMSANSQGTSAVPLLDIQILLCFWSGHPTFLLLENPQDLITGVGASFSEEQT
eukprot:TRINITY_DN12183_c0_g1_i2.p1 TRINITY_DN12183_c0_g1~~TRINITY_DN12183_c0_g1_i2.p1  ORF type:complete len:223 (-),score=38.74 TRINITY_DN12183_c0_g1_i2:65-733(-)